MGHPSSTAQEPNAAKNLCGKEELQSKSGEKVVAMEPRIELTAAHCSICKKNRRSAAAANACCAGKKDKQSLEKPRISDDSSAGVGVIEKPSLSETQTTDSLQSKEPSPQPTTISSIQSDRKYFANQCCVCGEMAPSPLAAKQCCSGRHKEDKRNLSKNVHFANDIILHNTAYSDYYDDDLKDEFVDKTDESDYSDGPGDRDNDDGRQVVSSKRKKSADEDGDFVIGREFKKLQWQIAELAKRKKENHHGFSCGRCNRVFNDRTDWRHHDIMCIVSSGLMESSATVRQSVIDAIVGRWPKETALAIMAKVARDGNNEPLRINDTPTVQRICALTASAASVSARMEEFPQSKFLFRF